jgi:hypothetical protein
MSGLLLSLGTLAGLAFVRSGKLRGRPPKTNEEKTLRELSETPWFSLAPGPHGYVAARPVRTDAFGLPYAPPFDEDIEPLSRFVQQQKMKMRKTGFDSISTVLPGRDIQRYWGQMSTNQRLISGIDWDRGEERAVNEGTIEEVYDDSEPWFRGSLTQRRKYLPTLPLPSHLADHSQYLTSIPFGTTATDQPISII